MARRPLAAPRTISGRGQLRVTRGLYVRRSAGRMAYVIYQARIVKKPIEATDGSKGHENEARNAAFEIHELFQDAVCFYIAALATCVPETTPVKETVRTRF